MWYYWCYPAIDIVEIILGTLMICYIFFIFWDFINRISLFKALGIGGFFSALIPVLSDYKLYVAYNKLLDFKGLKKRWHGLIPVIPVLYTVSLYIYSYASEVGFMGFIYKVMLDPESLKHPDYYDLYVVVVSVCFAVALIILILNQCVNVWTAVTTCVIVGDPKKHAAIYIVLPYLRSAALLGSAREFEEEMKSRERGYRFVHCGGLTKIEYLEKKD